MSIDLRSATDGKSLDALLERIQRHGTGRSKPKEDEATMIAIPSEAKEMAAAGRNKRTGTGRSSKVLVAAANDTLETIVHQRGLELTELIPTSEAAVAAGRC
jgi:hypothetical protein